MVSVATNLIFSHVKQLLTIYKQMGMAMYPHNFNYKNGSWAKFDPEAEPSWIWCKYLIFQNILVNVAMSGLIASRAWSADSSFGNVVEREHF